MELSRRQSLAYLGAILATGRLIPRVDAAETAVKTAAAAGPSTVHEIWEDLLDGNRRFVAGTPRARTLVPTRHELTEGQAPKGIVLGCADSRVSPTLVFDKSLGDLFVVRTAGNVVDPVALGSLEYAAEHLRSPLLVVLGHDRCGAVTAAAAGVKLESANLQAIVDRITLALKPLRDRATGDQLVRLGVEANVYHASASILARSKVMAELVVARKLTIVKAVKSRG